MRGGRLRDLKRREFEGLPEEEVPGHLFAERLARAICSDTATADDYFDVYRVIVPRTSKGKSGPRPLWEAWRARLLQAQGHSLLEAGRELGYITWGEIDLASAERRREHKGEANMASVASAERRVRRNEELLVACEKRIRDAHLAIPEHLRRPDPETTPAACRRAVRRPLARRSVAVEKAPDSPTGFQAGFQGP